MIAIFLVKCVDVNIFYWATSKTYLKMNEIDRAKKEGKKKELA